MARSKPEYQPIWIMVEGSGNFPIDMLRYDSCHPYRETDSLAIEHQNRSRKIILRRFMRPSMTPCTYDRWKSYRWEVIALYHNEELVQDWIRKNADDEKL